MQDTKTPARLLSEQWGRNLALARRRKEYSQAAFGARVQRDQPWVSRFERGKGNWTLEVMLMLAAALDRPVSELFDFPIAYVVMEQNRLGLSR